MLRLGVCLALMLVGMSSAIAQLPQVVDSRLGVDSVKLDGGKRLYGFMLERRNDNSIRFSVERKWLETTYPQLFAELAAREQKQFEEARIQRIERIETWIQSRSEDRGLVAFLQHELARFEAANPEEVNLKKFVTLELMPNRYRELFSQPPDRRKIAGLAFQNNLSAVTTTPVSQLKKQLEDQGVDINAETVNLSQEVVSVSMDSDRQWAARKAIVEHAFGKRLSFRAPET